MARDESISKPFGGQQDDDRSTLQNPQLMASEIAKAFQDLARGEQTASALERQLDGIESRIDQLLAAAEESSRQAQTQAHNHNPDTQNGVDESANK